ncbi:MAG: NlpC/P60 family N-terminal domain-containing protein [Pseudomonadota bacterium]
MIRSIFLLIAVMFLILLSGCFISPDTIRDIRELKQDHNAYLDGKAPGLQISPEEQRWRDQDYNNRHFSPWHQNRPQSGVTDIAVEFEKYGQNPGYGENGRKHAGNWIKKLKCNARLQAYSGDGYPAITIRQSSLRSLPTERPHFNRSRQAVSGYPFDNLQATAVMVNTPVFISHISRDKEWVWAETGYYFGWMQAQDVAFLPDEFMKKWETGRYAVIIKDKTPICDGEGLFLFRVSLGTIFPLLNDGEEGAEILVAVADQDRRAVLKKVTLPKDAAAAKPVPMTEAQMARLANELLNEPYGWGGLYGNRDCSAMTRDLFAPFGIWLPRNSGDQALKGGTFIDLSALSSEEKERKIISEGVPYLTLLWRKGHIMLYIGIHDGAPLVFHNLWGISTRTAQGRRGKLVVGHAAITTLHPGRELRNYDEATADLTKNILGMTLLVERHESAVSLGR